MNPSYLHKSQSIGSIFREILFGFNFSQLAIMELFLIGIIPTFILAYFLHRKYIPYVYMGVYAFIFILHIFLSRSNHLSDALVVNIAFLYAVIILMTLAFLLSSVFNRFRKKKHVYKRTDFLPLTVLLLGIVFLTLLPIRSGHLLCKTKVVSDQFSCDYYLQEDARLHRSWFRW